MAECCIHYETVKETKLLKLSNEDSWNTLPDAAVLRNERRFVQISQNLHEVQYLIYITIKVAEQYSL